MNTLARIPLFRDSADLDFERFDRRCIWKRFGDGEIVVDFEDPSTDVYFIISGEVRVLIRTPAGKEIILAEMHPASSSASSRQSTESPARPMSRR